MPQPSPRQVTRVAAYGLVVAQQKLLLCRISAQFPRLEGQWTLPGGGVEWREHPEQAMAREVEEETGLHVSAKGIATVHSNAVDTPDVLFHGISLIYHTHLTGGELRFETEGTTDMCAWWDAQELANLPLVIQVQAALPFVNWHA